MHWSSSFIKTGSTNAMKGCRTLSLVLIRIGHFIFFLQLSWRFCPHQLYPITGTTTKIIPHDVNDFDIISVYFISEFPIPTTIIENGMLNFLQMSLSLCGYWRESA